MNLNKVQFWNIPIGFLPVLLANTILSGKLAMVDPVYFIPSISCRLVEGVDTFIEEIPSKPSPGSIIVSPLRFILTSCKVGGTSVLTVKEDIGPSIVWIPFEVMSVLFEG